MGSILMDRRSYVKRMKGVFFLFCCCRFCKCSRSPSWPFLVQNSVLSSWNINTRLSSSGSTNQIHVRRSPKWHPDCPIHPPFRTIDVVNWWWLRWCGSCALLYFSALNSGGGGCPPVWGQWFDAKCEHSCGHGTVYLMYFYAVANFNSTQFL